MDEPAPRIRRALPGDLERYLDVVETVAAERWWIGVEPPVDREALGRRMLEALDDETILRLVVEHGQDLVGTLHAEEFHGIVSFGMMLVPAWRGRGLGARLLAALEGWALERRAHKLTLQVWPHNTAAIQLYERHGFAVEGRLRKHWRRRNGELWDADIMGLPLPVEEHGRTVEDGSGGEQPGRSSPVETAARQAGEHGQQHGTVESPTQRPGPHGGGVGRSPDGL